MANILPESAARSAWNEFRARAALTGGLALFAGAVFFAAALLPAYLILQIEQGAAAPTSDSSLATPGLDAQNVQERADILRARAVLARVAPVVLATSSPSQAIGGALALRPEGVAVNSITLSSSGSGEITIEGTTPDRDAINRYREALIGSGKFGSVSVPADALLGASGGNFSVTLTGIF